MKEELGDLSNTQVIPANTIARKRIKSLIANVDWALIICVCVCVESKGKGVE